MLLSQGVSGSTATPKKGGGRANYRVADAVVNDPHPPTPLHSWFEKVTSDKITKNIRRRLKNVDTTSRLAVEPSSSQRSTAVVRLRKRIKHKDIRNDTAHSNTVASFGGEINWGAYTQGK